MFDRDERQMHNYYNLARLLQVMYSNEYFENYIIQIIPAIEDNPRLDNLYNGLQNCAIGPIIHHLTQVQGNHKNKIAKLKALKVPATGANNDLIQQISIISRFKICVVDRLGHEWAEFKPNGYDRGTFLLEVFGKHLQSKYESVLYGTHAQQQTYNQCKSSELEWHDDLTDILKLHPCAPVIESKNTICAIFTPDKIYKRRFHEYEQYPLAFGDASVGKAKFLEQRPEFKNYEVNCFDQVLLDSKIISLYFRKSASHASHIKYDHNSSYKAFRQSGLFTGFPIINRCYAVKKPFSEMEQMQYGLLHVNQKWMPVELVRHNYITNGEDPYVFQAMEADTVFDFDETKMTNAQFRSFIGKTYCSSSHDIWRTNNYAEYLRARYSLKDRIISISEELDINGNPIYAIKYESDRKTWAMPIIYTYVLRHQAFIMQTKLAQIPADDIVHVCVDSIELKKPYPFDLGTNVGQWKVEAINFNVSQCPFDRHEDYNKTFRDAIEQTRDLRLTNKYTCIEGPAGSGKSYLINNLKKIYRTAIICASTHEAAHNIGGHTYHSIFGIGCEAKLQDSDSVCIIDECSMMDADHLDTIIKAYPSYKIVLVGDFCQLPVVNGTSINQHELYSKFAKVYLTKNYRQQNDPAFYEICTILRKASLGLSFSSKDYKKAVSILNSRVLPIPDYTSENDIYICGVNSQVDAINNLHKDDKVKKVIAVKTTRNFTNGTRGMLEGDKVKYEDRTCKFTDSWKLNFAATAHKVQGKTYTGNVIIDPSRLFEKNHLYVSITRATCLDNIYLTQPIRICH
jgi:ABC-type cobalamin/Fe3+-siderophores transport system ATPase subunit